MRLTAALFDQLMQFWFCIHDPFITQVLFKVHAEPGLAPDAFTAAPCDARVQHSAHVACMHEAGRCVGEERSWRKQLN